MIHVGIRELRNSVSRVVRRAMAGEQIVITVNGEPAARLGPLNAGAGEATVDDLVAAGLLRRPRTSSAPPPASPVCVSGGMTTAQILREHRSR